MSRETGTLRVTINNRAQRHRRPMSGSWLGSTRKTRLPKDWPKLRAQILERDGHRCTWFDHGQRCTAKATDVDHVHAGDDHRPTNLRSLCNPHHLAKSGAEGGNAGARRRRPTERHPGLR